MDSLTQAESLLVRATQIAPRWTRPWRNLGQTRLNAGNFAGAATAFGQALAIDPSSTRSRIALGRAVYRQGRADSATAIWRSAMATDPEGAALAQGNELERKELNIAAESVYVAALTRVSGSARLRTSLGFVLVTQNRFSEADEQFSLVLLADSTNERAKLGKDFLAKQRSEDARFGVGGTRGSAAATLDMGLPRAHTAGDTAAVYLRAAARTADLESRERVWLRCPLLDGGAAVPRSLGAAIGTRAGDDV